MTAKYGSETARVRISAIERGLDAGTDPNAIAKSLGITRNSLRNWCRDVGRKDLSDAMISQAGRPRTNQAHGTDAAYEKHLGRGETPCFRCIQAHAGANQQRAAIRKARTGKGAPQIHNPTVRDWDVASCLNGNPDDWFPFPGEFDEAHRAKMTCLTKCSLRDACLQMALESDAEWAKVGIYGGYTPAERANLKKKRRAA